MNPDRLYRDALDLHRDGRLAEAETGYRRLLAAQPRHAQALHYLGLLCYQTQRHDEAVKLIARAIELTPRNSDYLNNYGLALRAAGRLDEAVATYREAIALSPMDMALHNNLGNACQELGRYEEAAGCYRRVLHAVGPDANVLAALCHALMSLGNRCQQAGHYQQAEACYREALQYRGSDAALHFNLGNALRELGRPAEAAASYRRALQITPDDADAHNNLGNVLRELGRLDEAIACYERALQCNPALYHARVHLAHQKQHICDWSTLTEDTRQIRGWVAHAPQAQVSPFAFLALPGTTAAEQRRCATHWNANRFGSLHLQTQQRPYKHRRHDGGKLRLGYLSGDLRLHPLAFLVSELIELHDRSGFKVHAYSYATDDNSAQRKRLERGFDHFVDIGPMALTEAADRIHADGIDILIDLTGHTQASRSGIAALRPAPVLVNWLGFPGTMGELQGAPLFDYLLSDARITPLSAAADYAEELVLLPDCYQPNDRARPVAAAPTRAACDLPEQAFVFCCFNQSFKITPQVFASWMRLLAAVPDSVLWLLESNRWACENLRREAERQGVAAGRLVFAARLPIDQHLARHALADLFLDTLPYNAHTTTSDALWMGLPVLTCAGDTFAGRVAGSLLEAAQLPELVTTSLEEYERLALALARDRERLAALRQKLAHGRDRLPLFDTPRFTAGLEQAYRRMWQAHLEKTA
jgi:predicted O-linked N-acetylglucosamine transferase (SPINDLY family)